MTRILLLTTEPLPLPGWPATGAGLRAWGLAQGLRGRGHEVRLLMPRDAAAGFAPPPGAKPPTREFPEWVGEFDRAGLRDDPRLRDCDMILLQHWGLARDLGELEVPLAIDLAGPHLLERRLWGSASPEADLAEKLAALRRADFLCASGRLQRLYFLPYLSMAGWEIAGAVDPLPVIPFSLKADSAPAPPRADRFIYGGFFLPWQDPSRALDAALEEMDAAGRGELVFIGGAHPRVDVSRGKFEALAGRLGAHPRVRALEPMAYDDYVALLHEGGIALDLMARNAERELAFATRTALYLACGLPVVHNNYSELADLIGAAGAGWTLDPDDGAGFRALMRGLLRGEVDPAPRAASALRLVNEKLDWDRTIEPLAAYCSAPRPREGKTGAMVAFEARELRLASAAADVERLSAELATLKGKRWVRWGLRALSGRGWLAIPLAVVAAVAGIALIPVFWVNDLFARRGGVGER